MIDEKTLLEFGHFFPDTRQLEKDYLINLMLKTISINRISNELVFKGGTALYLFYGLGRFSEDLDFTHIGNDPGFYRRIDSMLDPAIKDFGLSYSVRKEKGNIIVKDAEGKPVGTRSELFIEGPLFTALKKGHKIKIDISTRDDLVMEPVAKTLVSRYNDIGTMLLCVMPLDEILAEKLCALIERRKARDLYDAYFIMKYKGAVYSDTLFAEKLRKRGERFGEADIISSIGRIGKKMWKEELSYLVKELPDIAEVVEFVKGRIGSIEA